MSNRNRRTWSLGTKLVGATMLVLAFAAGAVYFGLRAHERKSTLAAKETAALMVARLFSANVSAPLTFGDDKGVAESVATLAINEDVGYGAAFSVENQKVGPVLGELKRADVSVVLPTFVPDAPRTTRTRDWVVVDGPVVDPSGKVVGLSRVAFSLARENAAIATMEHEALGLSLAAALAVGLVLSVVSRQLIVRPVSRLSSAARRLEAGERVRVQAESRDEIGDLATAFATMSDAIAAREARIVERNRDMRLVLDNVEDGFLSVDREGRMADERSAILDRWFGPPEADESIFAFLERFAPQTGQWLRLGWDTILEDVFPLDLAIDQLPRRFVHGVLHFELRYRPLLDGETFRGMLVVVSDVTAQIERERAEAGQREMLAVFRRMLADRGAFGEFLEECGALVSAIAHHDDDDDVTLRRRIHTLKGNTSLFGVESVSRVCHELETRLIEGDARPSSAELRAIEELWTTLLERCAELGWNSQAGTVHLEPDDLKELLRAVRRGADRRELYDRIASWSCEPARLRLERIGEQITALSTRLCKARPRVEIVPTSLRLPPRKWAPLLTTLAHVVRNVVDHGLETEDERIATGKPLPPRVVLSLDTDGKDSVLLRIEDDGRGIAWEKIRARAAAAGLPHQTRRDLEEALYADSVSSRDEVTQTSGRGVGMGAVRAAVHACGGEMVVESETGRGTKLRIILPITMLVPDEQLISTFPSRLSVRPQPEAVS